MKIMKIIAITLFVLGVGIHAIFYTLDFLTVEKVMVNESSKQELYAKDIDRIKRINEDKYDVFMVGSDNIMKTEQLRSYAPYNTSPDFSMSKYRKVIVDLPDGEKPHATMFYFNGGVTGFELHVSSLDQIEM